MKNCKDYYIGVDDVTWYEEKKTKYGKFGKTVSLGYVEQVPVPYEGNTTVFSERNFSQKFVDSPELAIINAFYQDHADSNNPFLRAALFDDLYFDEEINCYVYDEYLTLDAMLPPKEAHWQKFLEGDYVLYRVHHEIQALQTTAVEIDLDKVQKKWEHKCEEICEKKRKCSKYVTAEDVPDTDVTVKGNMKASSLEDWKDFVEIVGSNVTVAVDKSDDSKSFTLKFDIKD